MVTTLTTTHVPLVFQRLETPDACHSTWELLRMMFPHLKEAQYHHYLEQAFRHQGDYWQLAVYVTYPEREGAVTPPSELLGVLGIKQEYHLYSGKTWYVEHFMIHPNARSMGIGGQMMRWVEVEAQKEEVETLSLDTLVENTPSQKFYYNHGYDIRGFHFLKRLNAHGSNAS
ncbi:MAG: GNAT family N-acetyltransferase [Vampirovibrionales bacterium]